MKWLISISFGELMLKGKNRGAFEHIAIDKIKRAISDFPVEEIYQELGKLYILAKPEDYPSMIKNIRKVFGIYYITICLRVNKSTEEILEGVLTFLEHKRDTNKKTFKVEVNRVDKRFLPKSPAFSAILGELVLDHYSDLTVDVHNPDFYIYVDIKENVYIYSERIKGYGGLPVGSSGRGLLLLSGGIDSPVAGFLMAKRGVEISAIHFHAYPFTSSRSETKVIELAKHLSNYTGKMTLYSVNLLGIYKKIKENCRERETTIHARRFMMRIGQRIAEKHHYDALISGECLGQVASQTIQGISVINEAVSIAVLRPLIAMDKTDIINWAIEIGTYETSILPYEDCCSVFSPNRPVTKPRLQDILSSEKSLDIELMVEEAISNIELLEINYVK